MKKSMKPLLISRRKFDIRVFALMTYYQDNKTLRGYFYNEGYLRTSCKEYGTNIDNKYVHLTKYPDGIFGAPQATQFPRLSISVCP